MKGFGTYKRRGALLLTAAAMAAISMIAMVGLPAMSSPYPPAKPKGQTSAAGEKAAFDYAGPGPGVDFEWVPGREDRPAGDCATRESPQPDLIAMD